MTATHDPAKALREFMVSNQVKVLNVAGSRASKEPDVTAFVTLVLAKAWQCHETA
jgi:hypothetical protein